MTEYWIAYSLNGVKSIKTGFHSHTDAELLLAKIKHICITCGWDLTDITITKVR